MSTYKALFSETGERITTFIEGIHFLLDENGKLLTELPVGTVNITQEEQDLYITNKYIRDTNGKPVLKEETIEQLTEKVLDNLDKAAANAYISGFYSAASGTNMYYDSDMDTQKLIAETYMRTKEDDWETKVRYPGRAPAGFVPIRARPTETSEESEKVVNLLNASEFKILIDDLDATFWTIKSKLWSKQEEVRTALSNNDKIALSNITW